jgi:hypothetical protein
MPGFLSGGFLELRLEPSDQQMELLGDGVATTVLQQRDTTVR